MPIPVFLLSTKAGGLGINLTAVRFFLLLKREINKLLNIKYIYSIVSI